VQRRPAKETCERNLQKRPAKETCKRDLQKRLTNSNRDVQRRPIHMKRDQQTGQENREPLPTASIISVLTRIHMARIHKLLIHMKRDQQTGQENREPPDAVRRVYPWSQFCIVLKSLATQLCLPYNPLLDSLVLLAPGFRGRGGGGRWGGGGV